MPAATLVLAGEVQQQHQPQASESFDWQPDSRGRHQLPQQQHSKERQRSKGGNTSPGVVVKEGRTLLHYAAWEGRILDMCGLLEAGAPVDAADAEGCTPLHLAAKAGFVKLDIMFRTQEEHQKEAVQTLLEAGADVNAMTTSRKTPLHFAARGGNEAVIRLLVSAGAELDAADSCGWTACHHAAARGHATAVQALLAAGADPLLPAHSSSLPNLTCTTARALAEAGRQTDGKRDCARLLQASEEEPSVALVLRRRIRQLTEELQQLQAAMQRQQQEGKGGKQHQLSLQEADGSGSVAEQGVTAQGEQEQATQGQVPPAAEPLLEEPGQPGPEEVAANSDGQKGRAPRRWPVQQLATGLCIVAAVVGICTSTGSRGRPRKQKPQALPKQQGSKEAQKADTASGPWPFGPIRLWPQK